MGAPEKRDFVKRQQGVALRAQLRDFATRFLGATETTANAAIAAAFADPQFKALNVDVCEASFRVYINEA